MQAQRTSLALACLALAVCSCSRAEPRAATEAPASQQNEAKPPPAARAQSAHAQAGQVRDRAGERYDENGALAHAAHTELAQPHARQGQASSLNLTSERHFGDAPRLEGAPLPVEQLLAAPDAHLGKPVKCEGKVARVCERAGCWLELQPPGGGEGLRVPMAGHAFFIPQDAVGHRAVIEGDLRRAELAPTRREHYQSEGMQALGPLALEATSVILR